MLAASARSSSSLRIQVIVEGKHFRVQGFGFRVRARVYGLGFWF